MTCFTFSRGAPEIRSAEVELVSETILPVTSSRVAASDTPSTLGWFSEMSKNFTLSVVHEVTLSAEDLWGVDAPEDPQVEDVLLFIEECGGASQVIQDWNLNDADVMELTVSGPGGSAVAD